MTGAKDDKQKPMPRLVLSTMARALLEVSKVATFGAEKYSPDNWLKVDNGLERYTDAKDRHRLEGAISEYDSESGLLHAAHEAWNALAALELKLRAAGAVTESDWPSEDHIESVGRNGNDGEAIKINTEVNCWCADCNVPIVMFGQPSEIIEEQQKDSLCPQCGDKRCERAKHHDNECSAKKKYRDLEKPETWKRGDIVNLYEGVATTCVELDSVAPDFGLIYWVDKKDVMKACEIPAHIRNVQSVEARS